MVRLISGYQDFAERQAERKRPIKMNGRANYPDSIRRIGNMGKQEDC